VKAFNPEEHVYDSPRLYYRTVLCGGPGEAGGVRERLAL